MLLVTNKAAKRVVIVIVLVSLFRGDRSKNERRAREDIIQQI